MRMFLTISTLAVLSTTAVAAADAKAGKAVYQSKCKGCHGPDGAGNPAVAKMMKVEIRDLKSPGVQALTDDDIKKIVTDGKGKMSAVATVTGVALDNVVAYVRSLKK